MTIKDNSQNSNTTNKDFTKDLDNPMTNALELEGINTQYLTKKLRRELNAKETKVFNDKDDGIIYSKNMTAWTIRQKARQDAHKLRGDYPAEKTEHSGRVTLEEIIKSQEKEEENGKE